MHRIAPSEKDSGQVTPEKRLRDSADQFRAKSGLKAQEYSGPILGIIFLRFASDLQREFPKLAGNSVRNLRYMRACAAAWSVRQNVQPLAAQIPWMHNCALLDRAKDAATREFYVRKTVEHGWSRSVLPANSSKSSPKCSCRMKKNAQARELEQAKARNVE